MCMMEFLICHVSGMAGDCGLEDEVGGEYRGPEMGHLAVGGAFVELDSRMKAS